MTWIARDLEIVSRLVPARTPTVAAKIVGRKPWAVENVWRSMGGKIRPWTNDDREYLRARWCCDPVAKIAAHLGRTPEEVVAEAERINLAVFDAAISDYDRWTDGDKATVQTMLRRGASYESIAKVLGRSAEAVKTFSQRNGFAPTRNGDWTDEEDAILRQHYGKEPSRKTAGRVGRSPDAVRARARVLGLKGRKVGTR